jgi:DNA-binding response OmpR family regulator
MFSILLVEDAPEFQTMVSKLLSHHHVIVTADPDTVAEHLETGSIDLIILDITLPKRDGFSVLHELQSDKRYHSIPVVCLTGKDQVSDKVTAFSLGADDYIQKPFNPIEFRARIESKLAKGLSRKGGSALLNIGSLSLDTVSHRAFASNTNKEVPLTQTEFKILQHLGKNPGQVFSREQLLASVWGDEGAVFDRAVDVHVCSLRKKLTEYGVQFKSVLGVGYKLVLSSKSEQKKVS